MKWLIAIVTAVIAIACGAKTVEQAGIKFTRTFLPPDQEKAYQGPEGYQVGGIDEETFNTIIDVADEVYTPILKKNGLTLTFERKWDDSTLNATCSRDVELVVVTMYGGLARHKYMTSEGFMLVLAHEIAHAMSIWPLYSGTWASSESSSDNMAVQQIARKLFSETESKCSCNFAPTYSRSIDQRCSKFTDENKNLICKRSLSGAVSLGAVLSDLGQEPIPSLDTPSKVIVRKTQTSHASAQCRLDQYGIAALCEKEIPEFPFLNTKNKAMPYICSYSPCWFKN